MIYAPVIIPTLCRYEHFVRCVESLRKNTWAQYTDVYIGLDYPAKESHREGYEKIKDYLKQNFTEFNHFTVIIRKKNYGASRNFVELRRACSEKYDRYIVMEDDIECSPVFLEYMDKMLEKYQDDESVIAVTGYCPPIQLKHREGANAIKQQLEAYTWGIGRWKNKTEQTIDYLSGSTLKKKFDEVYSSRRLFKMTDWAITDYIRSVVYSDFLSRGLEFLTDVTMRIFLTVTNKYVIMPTKTKTRNLGFDGSGLYCPEVSLNSNSRVTSSNYDYAHQSIDESTSFEPNVDEDFDNDLNREEFNHFDYVSKQDMKKYLDDAEIYCRHGRLWRTAQKAKAFSRRVIAHLKR